MESLQPSAVIISKTTSYVPSLEYVNTELVWLLVCPLDIQFQAIIVSSEILASKSSRVNGLQFRTLPTEILA